MTKPPSELVIGTAIVGGLVLLWLARDSIKAVADTAAGLVSGNNAITQNQTNAAGEKTTAYQGAGVLGTVGAATNAASGGVLASVGETVGGWFYEITHTDPLIQH